MLPLLRSRGPSAAPKAFYTALGVHGVFLGFLFISLRHGPAAIIIPRDLPDDIPVFYSPTLKSGVQIPAKIGLPGGKGTVGKGKGKKRVMRVQKHSAKPIVKPATTKPVPTKSVAQAVTKNKKQKMVSVPSEPQKKKQGISPKKIEKKEEPVLPEVTEEASEDESEMSQGSPIIVGRDSVAQFEREMAIQRAVSERWSVPKGLSPKLVCLVSIILDAHGAVQKWEIVQKSGVLAFDLAARTAALSTVYPEHVWGTTITLQFGHAS